MILERAQGHFADGQDATRRFWRRNWTLRKLHLCTAILSIADLVRMKWFSVTFFFWSSFVCFFFCANWDGFWRRWVVQSENFLFANCLYFMNRKIQIGTRLIVHVILLPCKNSTNIFFQISNYYISFKKIRCYLYEIWNFHLILSQISLISQTNTKDKNPTKIAKII